MPCLETICMVSFNDVHRHLIFIQSLKKSDAFYKSYFLSMYDGDQRQ